MRTFLSIILVVLFVPHVGAADWPQWLGPRRDGGSEETVAPWQTAPKVLWRQPVGEGHSSPVVAGGKTYIFTKTHDKDEEVIEAFNDVDGAKLWRAAYERGSFRSFYGNGPRATPTVHGGKVYTFGISGILTCSSAADGGKLWQIDTLKTYGAANLFFGASCSPIVEGERVLVNVGGKGASIVAFDKDTGKELWKNLDDKASYSSPIAIGTGDKRQLVFLTAKRLLAVSPLDGAVRWEFPLVDKLSESSTTPVLAGKLLFGSSVTYGGVGLKLDDNLAKAGKQWHDAALTCYFSTPVVVGKHLYLVTGAASLIKASATLHCVDVETGKKLWSRPNVGKYHASLLRTGDNKLLLLEEAGNLVLLDPDPAGYRELARAKICGNTWAHPALANGRLYVRDDRELVCVEMK